MKIGRGTGPWGRWSVAARALVTYYRQNLEYTDMRAQCWPTEHLPSSSNVSAEGIGMGAIIGVD
jgi:hypothetical protein